MIEDPWGSLFDQDPGTWRSREGLRDSAVLIGIVQRSGRDRVLLTKRRDDLSSHPGQVSLPGGSREGEETPLECALRETEEETGVPRDSVHVLGRMSDRTSNAGFRVAVFVGRIQGLPDYRPDPGEVDDLFEVTLSDLMVEDAWEHPELLRTNGVRIRVPHFHGAKHVVWGLTGWILQDFARRVRGVT